MLRVIKVVLTAMFGTLCFVEAAQASGWEDYVEFRDTVKPGTVPEIYVRQGKITIQPWTADEKTEMRGYIQKVYDKAPGLFHIGAAQGPIPFYRVNIGSSFGGHGSLWLSYMNTSVIAHELTHVTDAQHKIVRSAEFRKLVEPRIKELRSVMQKNGFNDPTSAEAAKRTDLIFAAGLPSYYAAATIQETLAEYVRASVLDPKFKAPPEISAFLNTRLFNGTSQDDPSVTLYRQGKIARLKRDYKTAYGLLSRAIEIDENFAEAYVERGLTLKSANQVKLAIDDFTNAINAMSEFDWQIYIPYTERGMALAGRAKYDGALADLLEAKRLSPNPKKLDPSIAKVKQMIDLQKKFQDKLKKAG